MLDDFVSVQDVGWANLHKDYIRRKQSVKAIENAIRGMQADRESRFLNNLYIFQTNTYIW
jgi:uncharacterized protein YeeX (DUF496 family)